MKVQHIQKLHDGTGRWEVMFKKKDFGDSLFMVRAQIVIVAAGTLGSTEIMLRY